MQSNLILLIIAFVAVFLILDSLTKQGMGKLDNAIQAYIPALTIPGVK